MVAIGVAFLLGVFVGAVWESRRASKVMRSLAEQARQLARGGLGAGYEVGRAGALPELIPAFGKALKNAGPKSTAALKKLAPAAKGKA